MEHNGTTLAQSAVWEKAGERLIVEVLLRSTSSVVVSLIPELCWSPMPAQPHPCWSQPLSPLADLTSDVSSQKGNLIRRGKLLSRSKILLKNTDRALLWVVGLCWPVWHPLLLVTLSLQVSLVLLLDHLVWLYLVRNHSHVKLTL